MLLSRKMLIAIPVLTSVACAKTPMALPERSEPFPPAAVLLVWQGTGTSYRMNQGAWERNPELDYDFTVVQRRYPDRWESTKTMHRRHPEYDGAAGPRSQTYQFSLVYDPPQDGRVPFRVASTLGDGEGRTDREFRDATLDLHARVSRMAPFNTYRLTQHYAYEAGRLEERVELLKVTGEGETPWVRVEERAELFAPHRFDEPPTVATESERG